MAKTLRQNFGRCGLWTLQNKQCRRAAVGIFVIDRDGTRSTLCAHHGKGLFREV